MKDKGRIFTQAYLLLTLLTPNSGQGLENGDIGADASLQQLLDTEISPESAAAETTKPASAKPLAKKHRKLTAHSVLSPADDPYQPDKNLFGPTREADTLWAIAERIAADRGLPADKLFIALYKANPQAFNRNDVNSLQIGVLLQIPGPDAVTALPTNANPVQSDTESKTATANAATQARVAELEQLTGSLQQQLAIKDQQLAGLQPSTPPTAPDSISASTALLISLGLATGLVMLGWLSRRNRQNQPVLDDNLHKVAQTDEFLQTKAVTALDSIQKPADETAKNGRGEFDFNFDLDTIISPKTLNDDFDSDVFDLTDIDEFETKIDLAKAYVDMGDYLAAKPIAEEILQKGSIAQQAIAQALLDEIKLVGG